METTMPVDTAIATVNFPTTIKARYRSTGLSWWPVLLFLPARLAFAFIAQGLVAGLFALRGSAGPMQAAAAWWPVSSTLTDVLCLLALAWLVRREGISLVDLFGVRGRAAVRQLAWIPVYLLAVAPGAILAHLVTRAYYGTALPPMIAVVDLSPAGAVYSVIVWPFVWAITEELVYLGYLLPRLEAMSGKTWLAILLVVFFWGLQHLAIPWLPDQTYLFSRVLASWFAISLFPVVFAFWGRRLVPLIAIHYLLDLSTAFLAGVLPLLGR
jgi:membrane protease YdiL (CAAX protease family)